MIIPTHKTFKFKLYKNKKNKELEKQIELAAKIYNHCIALHKRYYRLYGKYIHRFALINHITKLKKLPKYNEWKNLDAQAIQDIVECLASAFS